MDLNLLKSLMPFKYEPNKAVLNYSALLLLDKINFLFLLITVALFSVPAMTQNLEGSYTTMGRRCEDNHFFIPIEGAIEEMTFSKDGSFQHVTVSADVGAMTVKEVIEETKSQGQKDSDRVKSYERICRRSDGEILNAGYENICEKSEKQKKVYDQWWNEIMNSAAQEFEDDICQMTLTGDWSVQGEKLTVQAKSFEATSACGNEASSSFRSITVDYYFEDGFLYLTQPSNKHSQDFCGDSDWAEIYLKK